MVEGLAIHPHLCSYSSQSVFPRVMGSHSLPPSGANGLRKKLGLKYVQECESRKLQKNTDYIKNGSNKNCLELNFLQKTQYAHMSISPRRGDKGLQKLICLKYFNVLKWKSRCTVGLNAAENTNYIKKYFK